MSGSDSGTGGGGGFPYTSFNATPNFDSLLLQSLMSRLQLRPQSLYTPPPPPPGAKSLEHLLISDLLENLPSEYSDSDSETGNSSSSKSQIAREESRVEKEIVRTIHRGEIAKLKPNSGQTITIGEHHICVGFQEEAGSDFRVWEWHGHIMLFDDENGYAPEYIYGNYFEKITAATARISKEKEKEKPTEEEEDEENDEDGEKGTNSEEVGNAGLKELIDIADSASERILHRSLNANSARSNFI